MPFHRHHSLLVNRHDSTKQKYALELKSHYNDRILHLTKEDIKVYKKIKAQLQPKTWQNIFDNIHEKLPLLKTSVCAAVNDDDATRCADLFQTQITSFGRLWHKVLDTVTTGTNEALLQEMLEEIRFIGKRHVTFGARFDAEIWLHFKAAIMREFCPNSWSCSATLMSCNKLVHFIISEIKSAFLEAVRIQNGKRTTQVSTGVEVVRQCSFTPPPPSRQQSEMYAVTGAAVQMPYGRQMCGEVGLNRSHSSVQLAIGNIDDIIDSLGVIDVPLSGVVRPSYTRQTSVQGGSNQSHSTVQPAINIMGDIIDSLPMVDDSD